MVAIAVQINLIRPELALIEEFVDAATDAALAATSEI